MTNRILLHQKLIEILGSDNVYYQPPESVKISYPAIVYSLDDIVNTHANNAVYTQKTRYSITLIDLNPDNTIKEILSKLPSCSFERSFSSDNLNHYTFLLYF